MKTTVNLDEDDLKTLIADHFEIDGQKVSRITVLVSPRYNNFDAVIGHTISVSVEIDVPGIVKRRGPTPKECEDYDSK